MRLKISSRSSALARLQAFEVGQAIRRYYPNIEIEFLFRESLGDKNLTDPLWKMPAKGVFTEDFVQDLVTHQTDLVVHSWKDLPTERHPDLKILLTLNRADQRDLLLFKKKHLENYQKQLNKKFTKSEPIQIFSSSQRRIFHLRKFFQGALPFSVESEEAIQFKDVRGNIATRLHKTKEAVDIDGIIVAKAAIDRLMETEFEDLQEGRRQIHELMEHFEFMVLPLSENPNAAAQGALAIEIHKDRSDLENLLLPLNSKNDFICVQREREILSAHGGGCHQKIGISVLRKSYGQLEIVRGLTEKGQNIDRMTLIPLDNSRQDFEKKLMSLKKESVLWRSTSEISNSLQRKSFEYSLPPKVDGLFVTKAMELPEREVFSGNSLKNLSMDIVNKEKFNNEFAGYIWTSGLKTWKQLAQKGYWVHGSTESLGDLENPNIDTLARKKISWTKLTHTHAPSSPEAFYSASVATYELEIPDSVFNFLKEADVLFWTNSFVFDEYIKKHSNRAQQQIHCCGVGGTFRSLEKKLQDLMLKDETTFSNTDIDSSNSISAESKNCSVMGPFAFLNEEEWRQHERSINAII